MNYIIIIKALLSAWQALGFYVVHAGMSTPAVSASYWYGSKNVFFYADFRFGAPQYNVNFSYWDSEHQTVCQQDYNTKDLHKALKKAYAFQDYVKTLDIKA